MSDVTRPMGGGEPPEHDRTARRDDLLGREAAPGTARESGATAGTAREVPGGAGAGVVPPADTAHGTADTAHGTPAQAQGPAQGTTPAAAVPAAHGTPASGRTPADPSAPGPRTSPLLPREETDKLELRMQQAVSSFVDGPRAAVEEADQVLEEVAARFTEAVSQRRRTLRRSWEATDESTSATTDTEQLRLALRDYRELADRLLRH
ncbi:hypothetical protein [Streptomyces cinereospinus]|uniref:Uncharacterized protein n=1 Tax=Streptomyces cinereospinus TaxID=285561 RepID=A0ABV5N4B2_9ACTN